jgi:hypothetical protein
MDLFSIWISNPSLINVDFEITFIVKVVLGKKIERVQIEGAKKEKAGL